MKKSVGIVLTILLVVLAAAFIVHIVTSRNEVQRQQALVAERDANVSVLTQRNDQQKELIEEYQARIAEKDSTLEVTIVLYAKEKQRTDQQAAQAVQLAESHAREQRDLQERIDACSADLAQVTATCDTLSADLADAQRTNARYEQTITQYITYVGGLTPHLHWLQNEAERNWWEKFWDRDKLPKPSYPLPEPPVTPELH